MHFAHAYGNTDARMINRTPIRNGGLILIALAGSTALALFFHGPFGMEKNNGVMDYMYLTLAAAHLAWAVIRFIIPGWKREFPFQGPEILFATGLVLFLFSYIFATNANMDYVQRFAENNENLHLAPDSRTERFNTVARFIPLLFLDAVVFLGWRFSRRRPAGINGLEWYIENGALPLCLVSALLYALSLPSFARLQGLGLLGYVCLVPLLLVIRYAPGRWSIFYGTVFGVVQTMLVNYWLGTFSLVSLQVITILYLLLYAVFMTVVTAASKRYPRFGFILVPLLWVIFDYLRSKGFTGYPWGMLGTGQYKNIPLIQTAAVGGIWAVTLIVLLVNGCLCLAITEYRKDKLKALQPLAGMIAVYLLIIAAGSLSVLSWDRQISGEPVTVSLVQQNTDPRKNDYREGLKILKELTDKALPEKPDLVVWSETAFVPNIRRWSKLDPNRYPYSRLVFDFLNYQKGLSTWLLTGNDDYELVPTKDGQEERFDYNAAILFDPDGNRVKTYRKIHLVPVTEYLPFKYSLPKLYELIVTMDVHPWEPGTERVVFDHPKLAFSTPICFEDSFPNDIRAFVKKGADVIINISNDYWSLTEAEAMQHYTNALFRAVENGRQMLRASASGVTCHVDAVGRLKASLPMYREDILTVRLNPNNQRSTVYTAIGDWLPVLLTGVFLFFYIFSVVSRHRRGLSFFIDRSETRRDR